MKFTGNSQLTQCSACKKNFLKNSIQRNRHFFLHIPLKPQSSRLFSGPLFHELKRGYAQENGALSDVMSGRVYKGLKENNIISENDITLQLNIDGVQAFKSSKTSLTPVQDAVNELVPYLRNSDIILVGLSAATQKPDINLYLEPIIEELEDLHVNGFNCTSRSRGACNCQSPYNCGSCR